MNRLALGLLSLSTAFYLVFMVAPVGDAEHGWNAWVEVYQAIKGWADSGIWEDQDWETSLALPGFVATSCLSVFGPLLFPVVSRQRLAWWIVAILAMLAAVGLGPLIYLTTVEGTFRGLWFLAAAVIFHFAGLLCVRSGSLRQPES